MADAEHPQIYLITPPEFALSGFTQSLARVLDTVEVACLRLALSTANEDDVLRAGDALREVAHARDVPLVIERHVQMAERLGLDGVHLTDGARSVREARKALGADAIVGSFCGASRHDGMGAGEAGADYVAFGPVEAGALGDGRAAEHELFAWWSEMIEVPVVAEGGLTPDAVAALSPVADFLGIGQEIWGADDPAQALQSLVARI
ncbi:putative thiamine-phosphate pyrophosphorylase [Candidatus Rhodobacter oscarellae]|uniref:Putative thiamine-phosphate pyrophosphorylase n=1 Tax=Candidatus Rhodobacter oscarellae TaxID=1675527 RepID=A0A0J9GTB6_9RHOB|nr:thiamine phosphate synthase [Candidatus Rhodobacter lobularis]KMW56728.1 putative thiamine-phosphate pyrophosphorylase [Candidatus Rhodobacter lobularis]